MFFSSISSLAPEMQAATQVAAGVLPFFNSGKTVLLGREFRERYNLHCWMEFGGKREDNESLAETACREANEETAQSLSITLQQVQQAEQKGHYLDHYNEKTGVFYRMYCLLLGGYQVSPAVFQENAQHNENVEKMGWQYFPARDVIYSPDGSLPGVEDKLYNTMMVRLEKLKEQEFFQRDYLPNM